MNSYRIDFYKTENLSSDEKNAQRRNQKGIWLCAGKIYESRTPRNAIEQAFADPQKGFGIKEGVKLRALKL